MQHADLRTQQRLRGGLVCSDQGACVHPDPVTPDATIDDAAVDDAPVDAPVDAPADAPVPQDAPVDAARAYLSLRGDA